MSASSSSSSVSAAAETVTPQAPPQKTTSTTTEKEKPFEIHAGSGSATFFAKHNISLLCSAYKSNQVFSFGATNDGRLSCFHSVHNHPMALAVSARKGDVWIASKLHLIRCCDAGDPYNEANESSGGGGNFSSTLVPRTLHAIGNHEVHGIYPDDPYAPLFVSTRFSALCRLNLKDPEIAVDAVWKPPFISEIKGEDRCHLNDVCFVDGKPKYACCVCESDAVDGWRDHRESGGVVIDMDSNEIIARSLSMPHSIRWYKGALWVLQSGTGELGTIDLKTGEFTAHIFLPGFLRGLQFFERYAIVGSSLDRHENRFKGLELGKRLEEKKTTPICGFFIVDMTSWTVVEKVEIKHGNVHEIYDVAIVPGRRARVLGLNDDEGANYMHVSEPAVKTEKK